MTRSRPRARPSRRRWAGVVLGSAALHAVILGTVSIPGTAPPARPETVLLLPRVATVEPPETRIVPEPAETEPADPPSTAPEPTPSAGPPAAAPRPTRGAPVERTIPPSTLRALRNAPLPLVAGPGGIRRREPVVDARAAARARADSLLSARIADLPGVSPRDPGAVGLANGGVTVEIPWGGFVRGDRSDHVWRSERCGGKGDGKADKPGEGAARSAQC